MTERDYYVGGCTALLDAVGKTIQKMANIQKHLPEKKRAEKVIFVIMTDGMENASREYGYKEVKSMIEKEKEIYGWEFLFLGANIDAVAEAGRMGIRADRSVTFQNDSQGIAVNYQAVEETLSCMRAAASMAQVDGRWKEAIEKDYRKRKGKK